MPGYNKKALIRFGHKPPEKHQHQPHEHTKPTYVTTVQYAKTTDATKLLSKDKKKYIQQVIGTLLYYSRAVDATTLVALSSLASAQSTPTKVTMQQIRHLLDYIATHGNVILSYAKSNMILSIHSNASYLSKPKAQSRTGGHSSSSPTAPMTRPTMVSYSTPPKSSNQLCPWWQKLSSDCST
jgi:hypothetical protein